MVPVEAPELNHKVNGAVSDAVPEETPPRNMAVGWEEDRPLVWIVSKYWSCQFQVMLEAAFIVKVTLFEIPVAGTLPVPVHPVVRY